LKSTLRNALITQGLNNNITRKKILWRTTNDKIISIK
jgi:hypothetical protein